MELLLTFLLLVALLAVYFFSKLYEGCEFTVRASLVLKRPTPPY